MPKLGNMFPNNWPGNFKSIRITEAKGVEAPTQIREEFMKTKLYVECWDRRGNLATAE